MTLNPNTIMAPMLSLTDFKGQNLDLAGYLGQKHVVMVFNRGFM